MCEARGGQPGAPAAQLQRGGTETRSPPWENPNRTSGIARSAPLPHPKEEERRKKSDCSVSADRFLLEEQLFSVPHARLGGTGEPRGKARCSPSSRGFRHQNQLSSRLRNSQEEEKYYLQCIRKSLKA